MFPDYLSENLLGSLFKRKIPAPRPDLSDRLSGIWCLGICILTSFSGDSKVSLLVSRIESVEEPGNWGAGELWKGIDIMNQ